MPAPKGLIPVRLVSESSSGSGLVVVVSDALRIEGAPGFDGATLRQGHASRPVLAHLPGVVATVASFKDPCAARARR